MAGYVYFIAFVGWACLYWCTFSIDTALFLYIIENERLNISFLYIFCER